MNRVLAVTVLAVVMVSGRQAAAHHSNGFYFDMSTAITLEGEVLRVEWVNPHILLFIQSTNDKGEADRWIIQGSSNVRQVREAMGERLKPGAPIAARVYPPRRPLYLNDVLTVLAARPDDTRGTSRIAGGGQIRFANGEVIAFGGGPRF